MHEILFVSLGTTVLDEIRIPGQKPLLDVLGGSGVYGKEKTPEALAHRNSAC